MDIELKMAGSADSSTWNRIVESSLHGTLFHRWEWLKIIEKYTGTKLYPLIGVKGGQNPVGIIPIFFQKKGFLHLAFSPPPHSALMYLGPVMSDFEKLKQDKKEYNLLHFQQAIEKFLSNELHADYVDIRFPPGLGDPRAFKWSGYRVDLLFDYSLDLSHGIEYIWTRLKSNLRRDITNGIKKGYVIEVGNKGDFEYIVDMMEIRYKNQQKAATVGRDYLSEIFENYQDSITVFIAKYEGKILTGVVNVAFNNGFYSWIGNPKTNLEISPSPNDLLNWEAIKFGCEQGFHHYYFMGAAGNRRLHSYYSKFYPELCVRYGVKKSSLISDFMEKGYSGILKPVIGKMKG